MIEARLTASSNCSRLFEKGRSGRSPLESRLKMLMNVFCRNSLFTKWRADSKASACVFCPVSPVPASRSCKIRQTTLTARSGFSAGWAALGATVAAAAGVSAVCFCSSERAALPFTIRNDRTGCLTPPSYTVKSSALRLVTILPCASRTPTSRRTSLAEVLMTTSGRPLPVGGAGALSCPPANCANSKIANAVTLSLGIWDDYALTGRGLKDPKPWLALKSRSR